MNRMFRISALILSLICLITYCQAQTTVKKPLLLVFTGVIVKEKKQEPKKKPSKKTNVPAPTPDSTPSSSKPVIMTCDPVIADEVIAQVKASGKMDVITYSSDNAAIQRAILEKHIKLEAADNPADEKNAYQIARALNADFVLRMQGSISLEKVNIALEMVDIHKMQKWASASGSDIQVTSGPQAQESKRNAISNAASTTVSQILILGLGQKEMLNAAPVTAPTVNLPSAETPGKRNIQSDVDKYLKQSDIAIEKKDVPSAIYALRCAINLQPDNADIRVKLAELYLSMKLTNKAIDEYKSALFYNKSDEDIYSKLVAIYMNTGKFSDAVTYMEDAIRINPNNVDALLNLGDLYWNMSKIDEAEKSYLDAVNIAPDNPKVHDKLYKLYYAKKEYDKAFPQNYISKQITASDKSEVGKYAVLTQLIKDEYNSISSRLSSSRVDFDKQAITREDYYQECKSAVKEIDAFSDFMMKEKAPAKAVNAHSHAMLAISLLSQECGSLVSYFETEKRHYLDESDVFLSESKTEMDLYDKELAKM